MHDARVITEETTRRDQSLLELVLLIREATARELDRPFVGNARLDLFVGLGGNHKRRIAYTRINHPLQGMANDWPVRNSLETGR